MSIKYGCSSLTVHSYKTEVSGVPALLLARLVPLAIVALLSGVPVAFPALAPRLAALDQLLARCLDRLTCDKCAVVFAHGVNPVVVLEGFLVKCTSIFAFFSKMHQYFSDKCPY